MCGISILWSKTPIDESIHSTSLGALEPRGPDVSRREIIVAGDVTFHVGFARLQIQGGPGAEQPFTTMDGRIVVVNGEVFNYIDIVERLGITLPEGASDCAVIPALLDKGLSLAETARLLDGDFAICVVNPIAGTVAVTRDSYGIRPLFVGGWDSGTETGTGTDSGSIVSELKGFPSGTTHIARVEPGIVTTYNVNVNVKSQHPSSTTWHQVPWLKVPMWNASVEGLASGSAALRHALEAAVKKRLTTVRTVGACLSGGLDSSLVAALAARLLVRANVPLHTYSIGMAGSPDLHYAGIVATHIGSIHHERVVTVAECLDTIPSVIRAIESFDITTVRASVGNFLLAKFIAEVTPDVKVVLNGDGSDEVLGGYLYMRAAPNDAAFEAELDRLLREIHMFDVARSERTMAAHGLESRSPFLDRQFVAVARALPTGALRPTPTLMEKAILRSAFSGDSLLPDAILWRRKEAFSDGISRTDDSWFEAAKKEGTRRAGIDWQIRAKKYVVNTPLTPEALWYRELFHDTFVHINSDDSSAALAVAPHMWMPRFVEGATDPSARTLLHL